MDTEYAGVNSRNQHGTPLPSLVSRMRTASLNLAEPFNAPTKGSFFGDLSIVHQQLAPPQARQSKSRSYQSRVQSSSSPGGVFKVWEVTAAGQATFATKLTSLTLSGTRLPTPGCPKPNTLSS